MAICMAVRSTRAPSTDCLHSISQVQLCTSFDFLLRRLPLWPASCPYLFPCALKFIVAELKLGRFGALYTLLLLGNNNDHDVDDDNGQFAEECWFITFCTLWRACWLALMEASSAQPHKREWICAGTEATRHTVTSSKIKYGPNLSTLAVRSIGNGTGMGAAEEGWLHHGKRRKLPWSEARKTTFYGAINCCVSLSVSTSTVVSWIFAGFSFAKRRIRLHKI